MVPKIASKIRNKFFPRKAIPIGDIDSDALGIIRFVRDYTMTPICRQYALIEAVRHVARHKIPGAFLECGVWRGGSAMAMAKTLVQLDVFDRDIFLFDTFDGMTEPEDVDKRYDGTSAKSMAEQYADKITGKWVAVSEQEVRDNMALVGYPMEKIHLVPGTVEVTLPASAPSEIAILRLDTDWYRSTLHELETLYPRIVPGGILIIDDYGYFQGSRKATDEFIENRGLKLFLCRVDESCRIAVKNQ